MTTLRRDQVKLYAATKLYYVSKDGNNLNNGTSRDFPLLTLQAAIEKETPGVGEYIEIRCDDSGKYTIGSIVSPYTIPSGIIVNAKTAELENSYIKMNANSKFICRKFTEGTITNGSGSGIANFIADEFINTTVQNVIMNISPNTSTLNTNIGIMQCTSGTLIYQNIDIESIHTIGGGMYLLGNNSTAISSIAGLVSVLVNQLTKDISATNTIAVYIESNATVNLQSICKINVDLIQSGVGTLNYIQTEINGKYKQPLIAGDSTIAHTFDYTYRSRGTVQSPTAIQAGDRVHRTIHYAYTPTLGFQKRIQFETRIPTEDIDDTRYVVSLYHYEGGSETIQNVIDINTNTEHAFGLLGMTRVGNILLPSSHGTAGQMLISNGNTSTSWVSQIPNPQVAQTIKRTVQTVSTLMSEITDPTSSEGTQVMSVDITPVNVNNFLHVSIHLTGGINVSGRVCFAMFVDSETTARETTSENIETVEDIFIGARIAVSSLTNPLSLHTFKVRVGPTAPGRNYHLNGQGAGTQIYLNSCNTYIRIIELPY